MNSIRCHDSFSCVLLNQEENKRLFSFTEGFSHCISLNTTTDIVLEEDEENLKYAYKEEDEEDDSQKDDGIESVKGEIEPTEAPDIEEADNMTPNNEESKTPQGGDEKIEEDMTVPDNLMVIEEVSNWEERMNKANYNEMQRNAVGQCLKKIDEWLNFAANGNWE